MPEVQAFTPSVGAARNEAILGKFCDSSIIGLYWGSIGSYWACWVILGLYWVILGLYGPKQLKEVWVPHVAVACDTCSGHVSGCLAKSCDA